MLDVNSTVTGDHADPDFWPGARYELKANREGADREDVTFRVTFGEADPTGGQTFQLHVLTGADAADDAATGQLLVEGRTGQAASGESVQVWTGRAADAFYFDLSLLEPVSSAVTSGTALNLSEWKPEQAENTFGGTSVASIVIQVPHGYAGLAQGTRVAVWAATKLSDGSGGGVRPGAGAGADTRRPAVRGRDAGDVQQGGTQRPRSRRQRARGDALASHRAQRCPPG